MPIHFEDCYKYYRFYKLLQASPDKTDNYNIKMIFGVFFFNKKYTITTRTLAGSSGVTGLKWTCIKSKVTAKDKKSCGQYVW